MTAEPLVDHQSEREAETRTHIAAIEHTQAALPLVYQMDRAMEAVVNAAVKLVESNPFVGSKRGTVVDDAAYAELRAQVEHLRSIPTGAPLGRRWKPS